MGDLGREQAAQGAGASSLGAVAAAGGAVAMTQAARTLGSTAGSAHGEEQLIGWVLVGLAGAGALLCLYLALIWGLAAAILLAGPAGRTGRMLLPALRVLAPRLARRVSMGTAVATDQGKPQAVPPGMRSPYGSGASATRLCIMPRGPRDMRPPASHSPRRTALQGSGTQMRETQA